MTGTKFAAFALASVSLLLAVLTISVFASGGTGFMRMLGALMGVGALVSLCYAAALYWR